MLDIPILSRYLRIHIEILYLGILEELSSTLELEVTYSLPLEASAITCENYNWHPKSIQVLSPCRLLAPVPPYAFNIELAFSILIVLSLPAWSRILL